MGFVEYTMQYYYGTYRTNIATIVLPSTQVHCLGRILIFWLLPFTSKKIKERFRTDIPEITLKRTDKSYSPLYSLSPDYTIGRSCRTDPAPFLGCRQIPAIKALCRCKDLNLASFPGSQWLRIWALWLIPSDPHISGKMEVFSLPWNNPRKKTWLRIKDEPNS